MSETQSQTAAKPAAVKEPSEFEKLLERDGKKAVEFTPYGGADKIKLSVKIVQDLCCTPTKSGKVCSERDAINFMMLCLAKRLNPFDGDAHLLGYDSERWGPKFSLITAHQAYLKRAELHPEFDGFQSGLILVDKASEAEEMIEGDYYDKKKKTLVGGWCRVFMKTRKIPILKRLDLSTFMGFEGSRWTKDPAGMIAKCSEADAFRTLAPTMLGGMYMREEIEFDLSGNTSRQDQTFATVRQVTPEPPAKNGRRADAGDPAESDFQPQVVPAPAPEAAAEKPSALKPQDELCKLIIGEGFTFDDFMAWAVETGQYNEVAKDKIISFDDIAELDAKRFLKLRGLVASLKQRKGVEK